MYTTPRPQKNAIAAQAYFSEHFAKNDYYSEGDIEPGRWFGTGAIILGLTPDVPVTPEAFAALCQGRSPNDDRRLGQRVNTPGNRRLFHDFTCSAPKSVSLLAVTIGDHRIIDAHREAARIGIAELEFRAGVRVRANGANEDRNTSNVIGAEFLHDSTRALDPSLHTHFVIFNASFDAEDAKWKALQTGQMYDSISFATAIYRNELARRLLEMGYRIESRANAFEISGIPDELIARFSKRSAERDRAVSAMETKLGRKLSNNEISFAVHQSRAKKCKSMTRQQVREFQLEQMTEEEIKLLQSIVADSRNRPIQKMDAVEKSSLAHSVAHLFERKSVCGREQILKEALNYGCGRVRLTELKIAMKKSSELVPVGNGFSTREIVEKELFLIETLNVGRDSCRPLAFDFQPSEKVSSDQRMAIMHILCAVDQVTGFRGLAGAGKTTALQEVAAALKDRKVIYSAPTSAAVDVLRKDGFTDAMTLRGLLLGDHVQPGDVIVLDEAGLVGLDDMFELFKLVREHECRLILSGDTGQHSSVPRGDALRLLERHSLYRYGELSQIRRQRTSDYRKVVELAAAKEVRKALDTMADFGWISEAADYNVRAADEYVQTRGDGKSCILVAPTWGDINLVTHEVRNRLRERGEIEKEEQPFEVFNSLSRTLAEKRNLKQYRVGQRIIFNRKAGCFEIHEEVEIVSVGGEIKVLRKGGAVVKLCLKHADAFDVGEARRISVSVGDELLIRANRKTQGLINGQIVKVQSVNEGKIILTDGREIDDSYRHFCHGYCVTSHSSQGRTVDHVFLVTSASSGAAAHREQFYVSVSRGRDGCRIFTDDADLLRSRISRSTHRESALDLLGAELEKLGISPPRPVSEPVQDKPKSKQIMRDVGSRFWERMCELGRKLLRVGVEHVTPARSKQTGIIEL